MLHLSARGETSATATSGEAGGGGGNAERREKPPTEAPMLTKNEPNHTHVYNAPSWNVRTVRVFTLISKCSIHFRTCSYHRQGRRDLKAGTCSYHREGRRDLKAGTCFFLPNIFRHCPFSLALLFRTAKLRCQVKKILNTWEINVGSFLQYYVPPPELLHPCFGYELFHTWGR